jgi:hypothetical protein
VDELSNMQYLGRVCLFGNINYHKYSVRNTLYVCVCVLVVLGGGCEVFYVCMR